ncbi:uncharacterized protein EAF01_007502 [Botrytis porri]|uniref:Uncharacterized protein n=1 Tax=Botrytis porri TaxID=87229 RepID=A0A4Z1KCI8_9HELO|nr:uncharacterized protein EAF01_007502 [Botrytis porri]KAF7900199.1 hypothetical protein EAF01_007502 [Botrytis porri]TGO83883.1 hypothetical protein BPOR_0579g00020 [Botrytis porri]
MLFSAISILLLTTPALGQTLNAWRQTVYGEGCCSYAVDGNVTTYDEIDSLPKRLSLLLNFPAAYLGFYIQSSGSYITDYYVEAVESTTVKKIIVGKVSGATSNLTVVNFYDSAGTAPISTETLYLHITGVSDGGSETFVNEIYPIYSGDTIVYPSGQSAQPSPTQTNVIPTPTSTIFPTPTAPGITLNAWPTITATMPFVQDRTSSYIDGNPSTGLVASQYYLLFNTASTYEGFYILSQSPDFITDYYVIAHNPITYKQFEVCRVTNAKSNFTLCAFLDEDGNPGYRSATINIYQDGAGQGKLNEVYPIWPGDMLVDPNA